MSPVTSVEHPPPSTLRRRVYGGIREAFLFTRGTIEIDPLRDLTSWQRVLVTNLRVVFLVFRPDVYRSVDLHAQALTMKTLLSIVPLGAVTFAALTVFGGDPAQPDAVLRSLVGYLSASPELQAHIGEVLTGQGVRGTHLGGLTITILALTVMSLLGHVENSFNALFHAPTARRWRVRLLSYWALLTLGPVLLLTSVGLTAAFESTGFARFIDSLSVIGSFAIWSAPWIFTWIAFALIYVTVPNTSVRFVPAALAGVVAGTLWSIAKAAFAWYARANVTMHDIYGSLVAFPLFILWVYITWVLLLSGAQLCYAFQHAATYRPRSKLGPLSPSGLELVASRVLLEIARDFAHGRPPSRFDPLAVALGLDSNVLDDALQRLGKAGLVRTVDEGFVPARDLDTITLADVVTYLRVNDGRTPEVRRDAGLELLRHLLGQDAAAERDRIAGLTLRELLRKVDPPRGSGQSPV